MPQLNYKELKNHIASQKLNNIYLLTGEKYLIDNFEKLITNSAINNQNEDFNKITLTDENFTVDNLETAVETLPLNSDRKVVIVKNVPWDIIENSDVNNFITILSDIPDYCILIICENFKIQSTKNSTKFKKIQKKILEKGILSDLTQKDISLEDQLITWAKEDYSKILSLKNAKLIKELCGERDLTSIKNELEKICSYETSNKISEKSIKLVTHTSLKSSIFDLPKAMFSKNYKKSIQILQNLLNQKQQPISIVTILANEYIDIYRVKIFKNTPNGITNLEKYFDYKNKNFRIKNAKKRCSVLSENSLCKSLKLLLETDLNLKSTTLNPEILLETLIIKLIKLL